MDPNMQDLARRIYNIRLAANILMWSYPALIILVLVLVCIARGFNPFR